MDCYYRCTRCKRDDLPAQAFSPSQLKLKGRWCRECQNEHRRNKRAGIAPKRVTDVCLWCGKDIRHKRAHAKWCSSSCEMRAFRDANPGRQREYWIRSNYGIEPSAFDSMVDAQGGRCAICDKQPERWNIDHCHDTGAVRGLLCPQCNMGLGLMGDDPRVMRAAAEYLERPRLTSETRKAA